ncbi:hypothetical protein PCCS19_48020 [Paenibacillus sp. CCS19]|nr:hypothetical protein PCCS19_48020 [Paenibacillus cellulosilyticus]
MDLAAFDALAGSFIIEHRIILPTVPQLLGNLDEFIGLFIPKRMLGVLFPAEIFRRRA